jgi:hypothetical protein
MSGIETELPATPEAAHLPLEPVRWTLLALVVLGAFDIGRLVASALIGPWLAEMLMGTSSPVVIGDLNAPRIGIEVVAIALGVVVAGLIAVPLAKIILRR